MARKRGAQPNNRNAFKHGFYSKHFKGLEKKALESVSASDLTPEIDLLRVNMDRLMESYTATLKDHDTLARAEILRIIALSSGSIASLRRTQIAFNLKHAEAREIIQKLEQMDLGPDSSEEAQKDEDGNNV